MGKFVAHFNFTSSTWRSQPQQSDRVVKADRKQSPLLKGKGKQRIPHTHRRADFCICFQPCSSDAYLRVPR